MNLLLNDRLAPITSEIGFLERDAVSSADAYRSWQDEILRPYGMRLESSSVDGNLEVVLRRLLPLTVPIRCRFAFVQTQSAWTAFFDNGGQGADAVGPMQVLAAKLKCRSVRAAFVPDTMARKTHDSNKRFGATILEVFDSGGNSVRSIFAANDGGTWKFGEAGDRFSFEEMAAYRAKRVRERFTGDMLDRYLKQWGIEAFDERFYVAGDGRPSVLLTKAGKLPPDLKEIANL